MEINEDHIQTVGQIVIRLNRDEGSVIPVDQIIEEGISEGITKAEVMLVLRHLADEGEISFLDKNTIEVNN